MNEFQGEIRRMSPDPALPTFSEYTEAFKRLRQFAAQKKAMMTMALGRSFELPAFDDPEILRDRELLAAWELHNGPGWIGY